MTLFQKRLLEVAEQNSATSGILSGSHLEALERLKLHMIETNKTLNLTAITDDEGIILKHLVDSMAILPYLNGAKNLIDIGCGGGFPSLVIGILAPNVSVFSVDSVTKKVNYVKETGKMLDLSLDGSNRRAEELGQDKEYREKFDVACARAVGRLNLISELCIPLVKVGGSFIAMKSVDTDNEIKEAEKAIELLGGKIEEVKKYKLTNGLEEIERSIIVIRKVKPTPIKYPRNNSQISKKPL